MDSDWVFLTDMVFIDRRGRSYLAFGFPLEPRTGTRDHWLPERHHALEVAVRLVPGGGRWTGRRDGAHRQPLYRHRARADIYNFATGSLTHRVKKRGARRDGLPADA
jgi:hypothetical protein